MLKWIVDQVFFLKFRGCCSPVSIFFEYLKSYFILLKSVDFSHTVIRLFLYSAISVSSCPCSRRLALPSLSASLLSCCLGVLLCDIHFNHFIMHLVGRRWALDRWKFIKGALITICPLKMALLILFTGGNNSLKVRTVFEVCVVDHLHKLL